jgi:hypothetical protein
VGRLVSCGAKRRERAGDEAEVIESGQLLAPATLAARPVIIRLSDRRTSSSAVRRTTKIELKRHMATPNMSIDTSMNCRDV